MATEYYDVRRRHIEFQIILRSDAYEDASAKTPGTGQYITYCKMAERVFNLAK
jgi:hypothetical protein